MKQNQRYIVSGYIAAIVSICYWFIALNKKDSIVGVNKIGNIGCYVLFVSIFILVFLANCMTLKMCKGAVFFVNIGCRNTIILIIFFAVVCILVTPFLEDVWVFSNGITIAILGSGTMFFISNVKVENGNKVNISLLILLFCIFSVMAIGKVNTFSPVKASSSYSIHHSSAYIDSIYNVYHGEGFHGGITDQYGHYALLFLLPLHIFGCSTQTIGIILGILYGFVFSLGMLSFCKVIKSSIVKYFIIIAGGGYILSDAVALIYWQNLPHRLLFPVITLFLTVIESDKYVLLKEIIGFLIVTLAVIWNFESGIICCIAFAVFEVIVFIQDYKFSIKTVMSAMLKIIFWVLTPVVCAWGIVNFYNILCNAELLGMSSFIGMAVNTEYIEQLEATLEWGNKTYLHKIMVFLICFCWGITYIKCDRRNGNRVKANYAVTTAILGLGLSVYFINRPLATDNLVNIFFVICIGLLAGGMVETIKNWADLKYMEIYTLMKCIAGLYAIWVLIICGLRGFGVYQDFVVAYETGAYDYEDFKKLTYKIEESIPKDTWAIGEGMSAIYMELGWEKGTWGFASTQVEDILMQDQVFVSSSQYGYVLQEYRLICEFTYGDMVFGYFEREA